MNKYKNVYILLLSLVLAVYLFQLPAFRQVLLGLGNLGYLGALFAGALFVSSFTISIGLAVLWVLVAGFAPWQLALIAGVGAMIGDFIIFHFIRDGLMEEVKPVYESLGQGKFWKICKFLIKNKHFKWVLPFLGALIIASPFPDEIGIAMLGISKIKTSSFLLLTFALNVLGIFFILCAFSFIK